MTKSQRDPVLFLGMGLFIILMFLAAIC